MQFDVLPETPALFVEWERLAVVAQVSGRQVHDTRLAAFATVHGITNILTLNATDFKRFE
jgi:predicted nucleic acid-binding protein